MNHIRIHDVKIPLTDIKYLYEYFYESARKDGIDRDWSVLVNKNLELLENPYNQIKEGIYDEKKEPLYNDYINETKQNIITYIDRDEQGNPKYNDKGYPIITEMVCEYTKEAEKIAEKYKDLIERIAKKDETNVKFMKQYANIKLGQMDLYYIPNSIPPIIVKYCMENDEKETN